MDLVIGATGILGGVICRNLKAKGRPVRALVRPSSDPAKVAALRSEGIDTVEADLKDVTGLAAAFEGVTHVISTASSTLSRGEGDSIETVDRLGQMNAIHTARRAGVKQFVFISFPASEHPFPLQDAKREVEEVLRQSGMGHTILQPPHFWEVWLSPALGFDASQAKARIFGKGAAKLHWVSMLDVARAAVEALDNPAALNRTFAFGGDEALSLEEIVARYEAATGKSFERELLPEEVLRGMHGSEDPLQKSFGALMLVLHEGDEWTLDNAAFEAAFGFRPSGIDAHIQATASV